MHGSIVHDTISGRTFEVLVEGLVAKSQASDVRILQALPHGMYIMQLGSRQLPVKVETDAITGITLWINGYAYTYDVYQERHSRLLQILKASPASKNRSIKLSSPMPGLLKAVHVANGVTIRKGDVLFTLEAMKMENAIKAPIAGIVAQCSVQPGLPVEKGALLCMIEPLPS